MANENAEALRRDGGGRTDMTLRIASEPAKAAAELRALVAGGMTAGEVAASYGVTHKTVLRWRARLVEQLGEGAVGFAFAMDRRSGATRASWDERRRKASKPDLSKKKRGRPKKVVAN